MRKLIIILVSLVLLSTNCQKDPNEHYCLQIINSSNQKLNLFLDDSLKCSLFNNQHYAINLNAKETINNFYCLGSVSWEDRLKSGDKYYFLVYNRDSVLNIPCDSVEKYQPYKNKLELTLDYLNQNNWIITYP